MGLVKLSRFDRAKENPKKQPKFTRFGLIQSKLTRDNLLQPNFIGYEYDTVRNEK
jgi:hypothetical protein